MTDSERIAVELFGWWRVLPIPNEFDSDVTMVFSNGTDTACATAYCEGEYYEIDGDRSRNWPDFSDERLEWYWIRKMEDALAEKMLLHEYIHQLGWVPFTDEQCKEISALSRYQGYILLRATAAQRVSAALKVLGEVEIEAVKKAEQADKDHARAAKLLAKAKEIKQT